MKDVVSRSEFRAVAASDFESIQGLGMCRTRAISEMSIPGHLLKPDRAGTVVRFEYT